MKKILATLLAACMILSMLVVVPFTASAAATGANESTVGYTNVTPEVKTGTNLAGLETLGEETVYIIDSDAGLANLATLAASNDFAGKTVYLNASVATSAAIPNFAGTFDGQGYTVTLSGTNLFTAVNGPAIIQNVVVAGTSLGVIGTATADADGAVQITNVKNESTISTNKGSIGGIVGKSDGGVVKITNCTNAGSLTVTAETAIAAAIAGHITATAEVTITNCSNTGKFVSKEYIGSMVGLHYAGKTLTVTNCLNEGAIEGAAFMGGIVGCSTGTVVISNCTNKGTVAGTEAQAAVNSKSIGGIIGQVVVLTITNCVNAETATVTNVKLGEAKTEPGKFVGGIVGYAKGNLKASKCDNYADVTGPDECVGGIVGKTENAWVQLDQCNNHGDIQGTKYVGGLAGLSYSKSSLTSTYSASDGEKHTLNARFQYSNNYGAITGTEQVGGIVGGSWGTNGEAYVSCVNKGPVSGSQAGGILGYMTPSGSYTPLLDFVSCKNYALITTSTETIKFPGICCGYGAATVFMQKNNVDYSATAQWVGYQTREFEGAKELRLVGSIDSLEYNSVGFQITVSYDAGEGVVTKVLDKALTNAYNSLLADGAPIAAPTSYRGENAKLFALVIEGLEAGVEYTFTVQTYSVATQGADAVMGEAATFTVTL